MNSTYVTLLQGCRRIRAADTAVILIARGSHVCSLVLAENTLFVFYALDILQTIYKHD